MNNATLFAAALLALPFVAEVQAAATEARAVGEFHAIEFRGAGQLTVMVGAAPAVAVTADPARLAAVRTTVSNGVLVIEQQGGFWRPADPTVSVQVHVPTLTKLAVSGAAQAEVSGLHGGRTLMMLTGASQLTARGTVDHLEAQFTGASRADLTQLSAQRVDLAVTGAAQVQLNGRPPLPATVDGVGSLTSTGRLER